MIKPEHGKTYLCIVNDIVGEWKEKLTYRCNFKYKFHTWHDSDGLVFPCIVHKVVEEVKR